MKIFFSLFLFVLAQTLYAQSDWVKENYNKVEYDIPMRDGIKLHTIVYSPKDASATKYENISFDDILVKNLRVMDQTAFALCKENNMPIIVFNIKERGNILRILQGEKIGTLVS